MFKVNDEFDVCSIFTGGMHYYKVLRRENNILYCAADYIEIDGNYETEQSFEVKEDENGEYIVAWTYKGEEGRVYAKSEPVTEKENWDYDPCERCRASSRYNCKHCKYGDDGRYESPLDVYTPAELGITVKW